METNDIFSFTKKKSVIGITFTHNEKELVPFVMDYWKELGVDNLIVFDNMSNDGTVELLKEYPFVEVREYDTDGQFDEFFLTQLRNSVWKDYSSDWVIVTDFDEVPYYRGEIRFSDWLESREESIIHTRQFNVVREDLPEHYGMLLHKVEGSRFNHQGYRMDKCHTFNQNKIQDMYYELGMHNCHPKGNVKFLEYPEEFIFFHLRYLGEDYTVRKCQSRYDRLDEQTKERKAINFHYKKTIDDYKGELNNLGKIYSTLYEAERYL